MDLMVVHNAMALNDGKIFFHEHPIYLTTLSVKFWFWLPNGVAALVVGTDVNVMTVLVGMAPVTCVLNVTVLAVFAATMVPAGILAPNTLARQSAVQ